MIKLEKTHVRSGIGQAVVAYFFATLACVVLLVSSCGPQRETTPVNSDMHVASRPTSSTSGAASTSANGSSEESQKNLDAPLQQDVDLNANAALAFEDIPPERVLSVEELKAMLEDDSNPINVTDIRNRAEYRKGWIESAVNIPAGQQIVLRIDEVSTQSTLVLVGQGNERVAETRQTLIDLGIPEEHILVLDGGMDAWVAMDYPVSEDDNIGRYQC